MKSWYDLVMPDYWARLAPVPTREEIVQAYVGFVSGIRTVYPAAHIVCALGCMDATRSGSPWPGYIHEAVKKMDDPNMSELIFPFTGFKKHPRVRHPREMAERLTDHVSKKMDW